MPATGRQVTGCVGDDRECHPWLGGSPKRSSVWLGHRETLRSRLGSAPGVPQGHVTGGVRLSEVPCVCARELSKLRVLKKREDSPGGIPCGKEPPEAAESCPVAAKAARISPGSCVPCRWHPTPVPLEQGPEQSGCGRDEGWGEPETSAHHGARRVFATRNPLSTSPREVSD